MNTKEAPPSIRPTSQLAVLLSTVPLGLKQHWPTVTLSTQKVGTRAHLAPVPRQVNIPLPAATCRLEVRFGATERLMPQAVPKKRAASVVNCASGPC